MPSTTAEPQEIENYEKREDNSLSHYKSYDDYVANLALENSSELISNGKTEHAIAIIKNLLTHANNEFRLLSTSVHDDIYGHDHVLSALESYLKKENKPKVKIILQDTNNLTLEKLIKARKFIYICRKFISQVDIKVSSDDDSKIKQHFSIMDRIGYRFCPNIDEPPVAVACFNGPAAAINLQTQFDLIFDRSTLLE